MLGSCKVYVLCGKNFTTLHNAVNSGLLENNSNWEEGGKRTPKVQASRESGDMLYQKMFLCSTLQKSYLPLSFYKSYCIHKQQHCIYLDVLHVLMLSLGEEDLIFLCDLHWLILGQLTICATHSEFFVELGPFIKDLNGSGQSSKALITV